MISGRIIWVFLSMLIAGLPGLADAACSQANLRGTWYVVGVTGDTQASDMVESVRCKVVVGSTGAILASYSSCYVRNSSGLSAKNITSGLLSVAASCVVSGSFSLCRSGTCDTFRLQNAQMARDWNTFTLVGYSVSNPDVVSFFDAVKR